MARPTIVGLRASTACVAKVSTIFPIHTYVLVGFVKATLANDPCMLYSVKVLN